MATMLQNQAKEIHITLPWVGLLSSGIFNKQDMQPVHLLFKTRLLEGLTVLNISYLLIQNFDLLCVLLSIPSQPLESVSASASYYLLYLLWFG